MTDVLDICDAIAALIEPTASKRDDSRSRPKLGSEALPDMLYLWPRRERFVADGQGQLDRRNFELRLAWCVDDTFARSGGVEDRTVSDAIAAKVEAIRAVVAANRSGATWEWIQLDVADYEALATAERRGALIDISGYMGPE